MLFEEKKGEREKGGRCTTTLADLKLMKTWFGERYKVVLSFQYTFIQWGHYHQLCKVVVQIKETPMAFTNSLGISKYSLSSSKQKEKEKENSLSFYSSFLIP